MNKKECYNEWCTYNGALGGYGMHYCTKKEADFCSFKMSFEEYMDKKDEEAGLIRCKNCKYFEKEGACLNYVIEKEGRPTKDDYCSFAEKKEGESDNGD